MKSLNAKTLLEELLDFKEQMENTRNLDKPSSIKVDFQMKTEQGIKELVYRLQRYQSN